MLDLKITGGLILDGLGGKAFRADIGVAGDRIDAVGDLSAAGASQVLSADGMYVCPGFIDAHSHSDTYLLIEPNAWSKIFQGVTTEIVGNCGASAAPVTGTDCLPSDWASMEYPARWNTVAEYRKLLEEVRPAVNVVMLIGHNTMLRGVIGNAVRAASPREFAGVKTALERALDEGGRGMSMGLIYPPGMHADGKDIAELVSCVKERGGIYASHMRNEAGGVVEAVKEIIEIGYRTGAAVQASHLKVAGKRNWHLLDTVFELIRSARDKGVDIAADRYPYCAGATELDVVYPDWVLDGGREAALARIESLERRRIKAELESAHGPEDWENVVIGSTFHADNARFRGMSLTRVAEALGTDPVEALFHFGKTDGFRTGAFFFGLSEENMRRVLSEPYVMIGSDASLRAPAGPLSADYPHPRAYGAFPRFLRMALDGEFISTGEAVRKMTSLTARRFGLDDRGIIDTGKKADIVVFDGNTLRDTASYADPHRSAEGIKHVIVNGRLTMSEGRLSGDRAGEFL
ncbi:MAG: amidohydrolase family protein [Kiritimatiellia bacterium]